MLKLKKQQVIDRLQANYNMMSALLKEYNFTLKEEFELKMELGNTAGIIDVLKVTTTKIEE